MIHVVGLSKVYGRRTVVRDLCFDVGRGEVVGFLGPNGAGKTTTLRILAGFIGPSAGVVEVGGHDVMSEPIAARRLLGYMPEDCPFYPELRVREYLAFRAELKGVEAKARTRAIERAMDLARIRDRAESLVGHLSKGYRQRLGLADALLADPPLLILDEPTSGLDPNQIRDVRQVITDLAEAHTVLLSTHILAEVERSCDRAIVVHRGELVAQGSLEDLRRSRRARHAEIEVRISSSVPELLAGRVTERRAASPQGVHGAGGVFERWLVPLSEAPLDSVEAWVRELCAAGIGVQSAVLHKASLEEVFTELTTEPVEAAAEVAS